MLRTAGFSEIPGKEQTQAQSRDYLFEKSNSNYCGRKVSEFSLSRSIGF